MRPRKKTQGEKTQEFRNLRKKTQTEGKNSTFRYFCGKSSKQLEKNNVFYLNMRPKIKKHDFYQISNIIFL